MATRQLLDRGRPKGDLRETVFVDGLAPWPLIADPDLLFNRSPVPDYARKPVPGGEILFSSDPERAQAWRETVSNLERRLKIVKRADERLKTIGLEPIGDLTPHSFRRLYASLRYAVGDDPVYVADQLGHADAGGLSMREYASAVRRRDRITGRAREEFDWAIECGTIGHYRLRGAPECKCLCSGW